MAAATNYVINGSGSSNKTAYISEIVNLCFIVYNNFTTRGEQLFFFSVFEKTPLKGRKVFFTAKRDLYYTSKDLCVYIFESLFCMTLANCIVYIGPHSRAVTGFLIGETRDNTMCPLSKNFSHKLNCHQSI